MSDWIDVDEAPPLTAEVAARGELRVFGEIVRPATGTYTKSHGSQDELALATPRSVGRLEGSRADPSARMGRPPSGPSSKRQVTLRLDSEVVERFRASGPGWQSRMNAALRNAAGLLP